MAWELIPLKELFLQTCWMLHVGENPPSAAGLWRGEGCQSLLSHKTEAFLLCLIAVGDLDANAEVSKWPVIYRNAPYLQAWPVLARCEWISCKRLPHAVGCWWLVAWLYVPPVLGSLLRVGANPASLLWWRKHLRWGGGGKRENSQKTVALGPCFCIVTYIRKCWLVLVKVSQTSQSVAMAMDLISHSSSIQKKSREIHYFGEDRRQSCASNHLSWPGVNVGLEIKGSVPLNLWNLGRWDSWAGV